MIGYKAISQLTFDDCVHHIEYEKKNGNSPDSDVEKRYSLLLNELQMKDDELFEKNKASILGLECYIGLFPIAGAKAYKARHLEEARQMIDKAHSRCIIVLECIIVALFGLLSLFFIVM